MKLRGWSIALLSLLLAACGGAVPETSPEQDSAKAAAPVSGPERHILAFGDSLFAGYGLAEGQGYPAQLETALRDAGINAEIANAGVSGNTSAAGLQRLGFVLDAQEQKPDLVLLELGGNDLLRGISPEQTRENIGAMLAELKRRGIPVLLMGMRAPPNYGPEYQQAFDALYPELAEQYGAALVPFWLASIYRNPELFQSDRIHPTAAGINVLAGATVDEVAAALPVEVLEDK